MATIQRFEDIEAWQEARQLTNAIYAATRRAPFANDFGLRDQIRRATVSVMSNIAEGFERDGSREFVRFLLIAKGSVGEVRSQLYVALDQGYMDQETFEKHAESACRIARMISGLIAYLRKHDPT